MFSMLDLFFIAAALTAAVLGISARFRALGIGRPDAKEDRGESNGRLTELFTDGLLQKKSLSEPLPGWSHMALFAGFVLPFLLALFVISGVFIPVPGWLGKLCSIVMDLAGAAGLVGLVILVDRRYVSKPERLDNKPGDAVALLLIGGILFTGFSSEGLRIILADQAKASWSPVGYLFGLGYSLLFDEGTLSTVQFLARRVHFFLVLGLIGYFPYSKLWHLVSGPMNIYLRPRKHRGALDPIDIETALVFGTPNAENFTRKQLLDLDACTRCGRCQDVCPAHNTQKPLSPKQYIQDLKTHWRERLPQARKIMAAGGPSEEDIPESDIIGKSMDIETLWACTTCQACQEVCPVRVEHTPKIVDMRRFLVLMESNFPQEIQLVFKNSQNNSNPWGLGSSTRAEWAEGLEIPEYDGHEYLWYVGCSGSFDERYIKVSKSLAALFKEAELDFGILGKEEKCCGDSARRIGEEYLYQTLAMENVESWKALGVKKIITSCPHCYNTLKNEYGQFDGEFEVIHHTEWIEKQIREGRLPVVARAAGTPSGNGDACSLHDSCYLGRYNGIYDEPRRIVQAMTGASPVEFGKIREKSFCCGAGGGRMWFEENLGTRINESRAAEALETGTEKIVTACPFCLTMFEDGFKELAESTGRTPRVIDVAELVAAALPSAEEEETAETVEEAPLEAEEPAATEEPAPPEEAPAEVEEPAAIEEPAPPEEAAQETPAETVEEVPAEAAEPAAAEEPAPPEEAAQEAPAETVPDAPPEAEEPAATEDPAATEEPAPDPNKEETSS